MQKDALNNVHITDEQVLMTPEQLKAEFRWSYVAHAPFTILKWRLSMLVDLKPLPQRSAIASTW